MAVFIALLNPWRAFDAVKAHPRTILRILLVTVLATVPAVAFVARVDLDRFAERTLSARGALEKIPEAERPATLERTRKALGVAVPGGAAAKRAGFIFVVGLLAFALLKGASPDLRLGPCLAVIAVGSAPLLLSDLARLLLILWHDPLWIDFENPVASNPASWFQVEAKLPRALLQALDLFRLWTVWLSALGLAIVSGRKGWLPWAGPLTVYALSVLADVVGAAVSPG